MTKKPYEMYALSPDLFKDLHLDSLQGQAMYMQDYVSDLADDENNPDAFYFAGFHDILGHLVDMTEVDGDAHTKEERAKELDKRVNILKGALDAMHALLEMTKNGEFKKEG